MPSVDWPAKLAEAANTPRRRDVYHEYLDSPEWRETRKGALERADNRCQVCNTDKRLDAHHRTYENIGCEKPSDLTVLCRRCHELFHDNGPKVTKLKPAGRPKSRAKKKGKKQKQRNKPGHTLKMRKFVAALEERVPSGDYTADEIVTLTGMSYNKVKASLDTAARYKVGNVTRLKKSKRWRIKHPKDNPPRPASGKDMQALRSQLLQNAKRDLESELDRRCRNAVKRAA